MQTALCEQSEDFLNFSEPVFPINDDCSAFLHLLETENELSCFLLCIPKTAPLDLSNHVGLHGILHELDLGSLCNSEKAVINAAQEVLRHTNLMKKLIQS
jgi:hypothetical protein